MVPGVASGWGFSRPYTAAEPSAWTAKTASALGAIWRLATGGAISVTLAPSLSAARTGEDPAPAATASPEWWFFVMRARTLLDVMWRTHTSPLYVPVTNVLSLLETAISRRGSACSSKSRAFTSRYPSMLGSFPAWMRYHPLHAPLESPVTMDWSPDMNRRPVRRASPAHASTASAKMGCSGDRTLKR